MTSLVRRLSSTVGGLMEGMSVEGGFDALTIDRSGDDFFNEDMEHFHKIRHTIYAKASEKEGIMANVQECIAAGKSRVVLPVSLLNEIHPILTKKILADPFTYFPPAELALSDLAKQTGALAGPRQFESARHQSQAYDIHLGISGWLGAHGVTPRGLSAKLANRMVCVEGIVTKVSLIQPRLTQATYYVPELGRHVFRQYVDAVSIKPRIIDPQQNVIMSNKDAEGHTLELECGLSIYQDSQRLTIQEMPETTPTGQLPRTVEVVLEYDLVDCCKPGDRARVWGVFRTSAQTGNKSVVTGYSRSLLIANNVELLNVDKRSPQMTPANIKLFKEIANRDDTLELIAASIAPGISGHEAVKRGLALQLVGGHLKEVEGDGSRLRGDVHILLLGDPSCGKSQLLRFMMNLAPLSLGTTGRGSSAVGLTAAVVSDSETGERRLEAGAMVLADGGLVCIDEFDKMGFDDRVAVHEVMEQQRVSINKAGVTATLNARTSVLAAANPIYGLFDDSQPFNKQVNFPDSLLSRFDLIFLIRESGTAEQDRRICSQVLSQLRIPPPDSVLSSATVMTGGSGKTGRTSAAQSKVTALATIQPDAVGKGILTRAAGDATANKANAWTRMPAALVTKEGGTTRAIQADKNKILTVDFLRKFVLYCKAQPAPLLTEAAAEDIADYYASLRQRIADSDRGRGGSETRATHAKALPTPRLLEAVVRLATAHAKLKLKKTIDVDDVVEAKRLISYTMCGDEYAVPEREEETSAAADEEEPRPKTTRRRRASRAFEGDETDQLAENLREMCLQEGRKKPRRGSDEAVASQAAKLASAISDVRLTEMRSAVQYAEHKFDQQEWSTDELQRVVNKRMLQERHKVFNNDEFQAGLMVLQTVNRLMLVGDTVYLV